MEIACLGCGVVDPILIPIRDETRKKNGVYLCGQCYDEYRRGYLRLSMCLSCGRDCMDDTDDSPVLCKTCKTFSPQATLEAEPEDYERHGYLGKQRYLLPPKPATMCVRKALRLFVDARKSEDFRITVDRAKSMFKVLNHLPDSIIVVGMMKQVADSLNLTWSEYHHKLGDTDRAEEGLDELVSIYLVNGYAAYSAIDDDWDEKELMVSTEKRHFAKYLEDYPETICLEKDDQFADLPF